MLQERPAIIVISSHVVRGSVGNRAMVFALQKLGHQVWAVPTITLPWHPGHGPATRIVADAAAFQAMLDDLANAPWHGEVGAIISGYLGDAEQADAIATLVGELKTASPDLIYACDPVIGDDNGLYVDRSIAKAIRDRLVPIADLVTPNCFELAWLCGADGFSDNDEILRAAREMQCPQVLVTSAFSMLRNATGNLLMEKGGAILAEHSAVVDPLNGPGDLTAALFVSWQMQGLEAGEALRRTTASVFDILARSARAGADELMLERFASHLIKSISSVQMRNLVATVNSGVQDTGS